MVPQVMNLKSPVHSRECDLVNVVNYFHCVPDFTSSLLQFLFFSVMLCFSLSVCKEDYFAIF
jgi:hypothetical protein